MEWWFYGPVILAVVMFLLVGTICERRIEAAIRRFIERRQAQLALSRQPPECADNCCSTMDLPVPRSSTLVNKSMYTPSLRTLKACKTETSLMEDKHVLEVSS